MTKILILQGISGSGKSTFANEQVNSNLETISISRDAMREKFLGSKENLAKYFETGMDYSFEKFISEEFERELAKQLHKNRQTIIIDNTNLKKKYIQAYIDVFGDLNVPIDSVEFVKFDTPYDECLRRIKLRDKKPVSEEVLRRQYDQFRSMSFTLDDFIKDAQWLMSRPKKRWYYTNFDVVPTKQNSDLPKAYIFDIDGTLAHRRVRIDKIPNVFRSFYDYDSCGDDIPVNVLQDIILSLVEANSLQHNDFTILFVSGRKESGRAQTEDFLISNVLTHNYKLFMRKENDNRNDAIVKYEIFNDYIRGKYNVLGVFDDRKRVLAMWEELGIKTFNVGHLNEEF